MYKTIICLLIVALIFATITFKCSHNEDLIHYGDNNYYFVSVKTNSGRNDCWYYGTIQKSDYQKWVNGDPGTIFIYSTRHECMGYRVNIASITTIFNKGSAPNWLPMNFWL